MLKYSFNHLYYLILRALHSLGGSASVSEIEDIVAEFLNLTEEEISATRGGVTTKLNHDLRKARTYLMDQDLLESSDRGVWALTPKGLKTKEILPKSFGHKGKSKKSNRKKANFKLSEPDMAPIDIPNDNEPNEITWKEELLNTLKEISPSGFERLCQRLLRELGFQNVEVSGKPNDGGIDGKGILRLGGILSFHVVFQAKRYKETVSSSVIRDFRGSMSANVDKGLLITTGRFTREARKEAQRDGASPIDLIDGEYLAEKLKELKLGIQVELMEKVNINTNWFKNI